MPYTEMDSPSGRSIGCLSSACSSRNAAPKNRANGVSSPSSQTTGVVPRLPWSCQAQAGVTTKSPGFIGSFSPATAV